MGGVGVEKMNDFGYRELIVWKKAKLFVRIVYAHVKQLPTEEKYALGDQIRRAVVSIASNIAEGNGRAGSKDYAHFLSIARGSLYETMAQLEIASDLGYLEIAPEVETQAVEIGRMLSAMMKKFSHASTPTPTPTPKPTPKPSTYT